MTLKYEILKRLVKAANIKKMWTGMSTEELLENRRKQNAKNRIPNLKDDAFDISRIEIMGCPVLKLIHRKKADRANLFLIGGGMISAPRPGSIKKALRFAKETGLDVFVPYYPLTATLSSDEFRFHISSADHTSSATQHLPSSVCTPIHAHADLCEIP